MPSVAIGVDLGASHLSVGFVDCHGKVHEKKIARIDNTAPAKVTLAFMAEVIKSLTPKGEKICGVGLGLPGNHDSKRGICHVSPNFQAWHEVPVTEILSKSLNMNVWMLNDVRMATLGELHFGAGKGIDNLVMIAIGTGIGGGVVINRKLLIGPDEAAGEIGHITILPNGPLCNCGNRGCLEALATGPAIAARGAEAILHGRAPILKKKITQLEDLDAKIIAEAALEGEEASLEIIEEAGEALGIAIASLALILNPDRFILGGGVALTGKPLFSAIHHTLNERLHFIKPSVVKIVPASLGVEAGLIGSGAYALIKAGELAYE